MRAQAPRAIVCGTSLGSFLKRATAEGDGCPSADRRSNYAASPRFPATSGHPSLSITPPCHAGLSLCLANEMLFHLSTPDKWQQGRGGGRQRRLAWEWGQGSQQRMCDSCLRDDNTVTLLGVWLLDEVSEVEVIAGRNGGYFHCVRFALSCFFCLSLTQPLKKDTNNERSRHNNSWTKVTEKSCQRGLHFALDTTLRHGYHASQSKHPKHFPHKECRTKVENHRDDAGQSFLVTSDERCVTHHKVTHLRKVESPLKHLKGGQTEPGSEQKSDTNPVDQQNTKLTGQIVKVAKSQRDSTLAVPDCRFPWSRETVLQKKISVLFFLLKKKALLLCCTILFEQLSFKQEKNQTHLLVKITKTSLCLFTHSAIFCCYCFMSRSTHWPQQFPATCSLKYFFYSFFPMLWLAAVITVINHHLPEHIRTMCVTQPPAKVKITKCLQSFPSRWRL